MYYLIYKITNLIDGKFYIGQHATENLNDGYMGGGIYLIKAQNKHGRENFKKEYLFCFDTWEKMNEMEETLVDEEFLKRKDEVYNLQLGGQKPLATEETKQKIRDSWTPERRQNQIERNLKMWSQERRKELAERNYDMWTEEKRKSQSEKFSGENNPMFGRGDEVSARRATLESKEIHREASKKLWEDEEYRNKIKEANNSEEGKAKRSAASFAQNTPEMKKQKSEKLKGRVRSPEHARNISIGHAKRRIAKGIAKDGDFDLVNSI